MRRRRVLLDAATPHVWAATVAASASAAGHWTSVLCDITADRTDAGNGSSGDHASGGNHQQQQLQTQQQQQRCWQHASFTLVYAAAALFPPYDNNPLGGLEQNLVPSLLTSIARLCCITAEELHQYTEVPPLRASIASMVCPVSAADAGCLSAEHKVCQVHRTV